MPSVVQLVCLASKAVHSIEEEEEERGLLSRLCVIWCWSVYCWYWHNGQKTLHSNWTLEQMSLLLHRLFLTTFFFQHPTACYPESRETPGWCRKESTGRVRVCQAAAEEGSQADHGEGQCGQKPECALVWEASHSSPWLTHPCGQHRNGDHQGMLPWTLKWPGWIQQPYTIKLKPGAVLFPIKKPRRIHLP